MTDKLVELGEREDKVSMEGTARLSGAVHARRGLTPLGELGRARGGRICCEDAEFCVEEGEVSRMAEEEGAGGVEGGA